MKNGDREVAVFLATRGLSDQRSSRLLDRINFMRLEKGFQFKDVDASYPKRTLENEFDTFPSGLPVILRSSMLSPGTP